MLSSTCHSLQTHVKVIVRTGIVVCLALGLTTSCERGPVVAAPQSENTYRSANAPRHREKPYVLVISLDGYRYDYTDLYEAPNLRRFANTGIRAEALIPGYPPDTFPNHYGIATGMFPGTHGIVGNSFFDRARGARYRLGDAESVQDGSWYGGAPLWVAAEQQGMLAASYFWVGSEADIQNTRPTYYHQYEASVPHSERIESVLEWLEYPDAYRPHLITLYFSSIDTAAHRSGTTSSELQTAIRNLDRQLGSLFDRVATLGIAINIFVVSDHGMIDLDPGRIIYLDRLVDLTGARVVGLGAHSYLYVDDARRASDLYADLKAQERNYRVYRRGETPETWHADHGRFGDIVIQADAPYSIRLERTRGSFSAAGHGYDPHQYPQMHGIFYASGPDLAESTVIPSFENVHIYPLIMRILGLEVPAGIDGRLEVLRGILRAPF